MRQSKAALVCLLLSSLLLFSCERWAYVPPLPPEVDLRTYDLPAATTSEAGVNNTVDVLGLRVADGGVYVDLCVRGVDALENAARNIAAGLSDRPATRVEVRKPDGTAIELLKRQVAFSYARTISHADPPIRRVDDQTFLAVAMLRTSEQLQTGEYSFRFCESWSEDYLNHYAAPTDFQWRAITARLATEP